MAIERQVPDPAQIAEPVQDLTNERSTEDIDEEIIEVLDAMGEGEDNIQMQEDGSAILGPEEPMMPEVGFAENLAEVISPQELSTIYIELVGAIESDKSSRQDWENTYTDGLKYLGMKFDDNRSEPFAGASGVIHPLLGESVTQFQAQAYKELLPAGGPVKTQVIGAYDGLVEEQAQRVKEFMNYQITHVMEEYDEELDQMLFYLPLAGSAFKKVYYDETLGRPVSKFVAPEDLIVPYYTTDLETCSRITHVVKMPENDVRKLQAIGFYKNVDVKNEKNNSTTEILNDISPDSASTDNPDRVTRRIQEAVHRKNLKNNRDAPMVDIEPIDEPSVPTPPDANFYDDANERSMELPLETKRKEPTLLRPSNAKSVVEHPSKKPIPQSKKAKSEAQPTLFSENMANYEQPALDLLESPKTVIRQQLSDEALEENARMLENVLDDYGVKGEIISVRPGPVVTMYELEPAPGLKASRVIGLADDIARSMSALAARVSTVPGRTVIGIELPNDHRETVLLREILSARDYGDGKHGLPLALGKNIGGIPEVADLAKMPHLLIAGTTGSGKSVAINTMLLSLLYKLSPDECRMIMIDPKMLELICL